MEKRSFAFVLGMLFLLAARSSSENRPGAAMLALPMSVRQMGMGDVSVGGSDILRVWCNPSLLANQKTSGEAALVGASMWGGLQSIGGGGIGWRINPNLVAGGLLGYYSLSAPEMDKNGELTNSSLSQDTMALGLAAGALMDVYRFGITVKRISDSVASEKTSAWALDLGAMTDISDVAFGVALRNIGQTLQQVEGTGINQVLPTEIRGSASYSYTPLNINAGVEYVSLVQKDWEIGVGMEWWAVNNAALRGGLTGIGGKDVMRLTLGISASIRGLGLDYAFSSYQLGFVNRFSVSYSFKKNEPLRLPAETQEDSQKTQTVNETAPKISANDLYEAGLESYKTGEYNKSIEQAELATKTDPKLWQAWQLDGNARIAIGDKNGALVVYKYALGIEPNNPDLARYVEQLEQSLKQ